MSLRRVLSSFKDHPPRITGLLTTANSFSSFLPRAKYLGEPIHYGTRKYGGATAVSIPRLRLQFLRAVKDKDGKEAEHHYSYIKKALQTLPLIDMSWSKYDSLGLEDLICALRFLSQCVHRSNVRLVQQILEDSKRYFGIEINSQLLSLSLQAFVSSNEIAMAHSYLHRRYPFQLTREHFRIIMMGYKDTGDIVRLRSCFETMEKCHYQPTAEEYRVLIDAIFLLPQHPSEDDIIQIFNQMQQSNVPYDANILQLIKSHWQRLTSQDSPRLEEEYRKRFEPCISAEQLETWIEELRRTMLMYGRRPALRKLEQMRMRGFIPDVRTLTNMMHTVASVEEMEHLEDALGVRANVVAWSVLIKNALTKRGLLVALSIYDEAKASGIQADPPMVHPLLRALCSATLREPPESALNRALSIYRDVCDSDAVTLAQTDSESPSRKAPDTAMYNTLLRAFTSSSNKKFLSIAVDILEDMSKRRISLDSMTAASIGVLLVRSASSHEQAYQSYQRVRALKDGILDDKAYAAILNAFCDASFNGHTFPPVQDFFTIVQDMQAAGHQMTCEIYTILLKRYASFATKLPSVEDHETRLATQKALEAAIRRTHNILTVDATVNPDIPLWNQLMDAYSRVGAFASALQVWNTMRLSRQFNNASVSIILDACGFAGAHRTATILCANLLDSGFTFNIRNWNTWVECLCRMDRLDAAMKTVCLEMPQEPEYCRPNQTTIQILLRFAQQKNKQEEVRVRIKRYLPELWNSLPAAIRNHQ